MADTTFRGPVLSVGSLEIQAGTSASIEPLDGPVGSYQGYATLDPRSVGVPLVNFRPGQVTAFANCGDFYTVDAIPQAFSSTALAAAQALTASTPMALATVAVTNFSAGAASIGVGVALLPQGTSVVQTALIALDFGFTTGTTVANSTVVTVADSSKFTLGQWVEIPGVGNSSGTQGLFTQVTAISTSNTTTINVSAAPATALGVPIGGALLFGGTLLPPATQFGPSAVTPLSHSPRLAAGALRIMNPAEMLARNISVQAATITSGTGTILVTGYDVWGQPISELLTASGTTPVYGKKGFKYIAAATPQTLGTTVTPNYSLGIGDTFSFPLRCDQAAYLQIWAGNTTISNTVGFTAAATTSPATNTTGDVRGTIQLSGIGGGTPITNVATSNNVLRLTIIQNLTPQQMVNTNPNSLTAMFGVTNSTN
jgi:hypothetical protein